MQPVRSVESHKVMHRRRDKFSSPRDLHVRIRVTHDGVSARIDNFAIHAGVMSSFLLDDLEHTGFSEMP